MTTEACDAVSAMEFAEFMWMEDLDDFDREVEQRLLEEDAISLEWHQMMDDEEDFYEQLEHLRDAELFDPMDSEFKETELSSSMDSSSSDLNPLADAFVPTPCGDSVGMQ